MTNNTNYRTQITLNTLLYNTKYSSDTHSKTKLKTHKDTRTFQTIQAVIFRNARLIDKSQRLEEQLKFVEGRIQELQNDIPTEQRNWIDNFMELSKEINGFIYNWKVGTEESRNVLVKKYVDHVVHVKGEELKIVYTEYIQELLSLC